MEGGSYQASQFPGAQTVPFIFSATVSMNSHSAEASTVTRFASHLLTLGYVNRLLRTVFNAKCKYAINANVSLKFYIGFGNVDNRLSITKT